MILSSIRRIAAVGAIVLLALLTVALGGEAYGADRRCGIITEVSISDLPSGGFVVIGETKFLVGGVQPRNISVPWSELRVGRQACAEGRFVVTSVPGVVDLYDGSIILVASLPNTSTAPTGSPVTQFVIGIWTLVALAGAGLLRWRHSLIR